MRISKRRVRNISNYLYQVPLDSSFRVRVPLESRGEAILKHAGFEGSPSQGDTILPAACGPVSRFNSEGKWLVHRDRPKESRYIRTVSWSWKDWGGNEHEDFRSIYRDCYPRTLVPPPAVELTYVQHGGQAYLISSSLKNVSSAEDGNRHVVNLCLELGRECEIVRDDLKAFAPPATRNVNWKLLPPGKHPWPRVKEHIDASLTRLSPKSKSVIYDRKRTIMTHEPTEQHVGIGGFADYIAYVFASRELVILESVRRGNAIYAFGQDWQIVSQLSKAEIIAGDLHIERIVHSEGWKDRLAKLLNARRAA